MAADSPASGIASNSELAGPAARWLTETLDDPGPFRLRRLAGGNSNETFELTSPWGRWVLRRPPAAVIADKAHDMTREYRVLAALAGRGVPAPRPVGLCDDPDVTARPFLVMEHMPGVSLSAALPPEWPAGAAVVNEIGAAVIDALAALHTVDYRAARLEGFGRPEGFLARQVTRWRSQYQGYAMRDLEFFEPVAGWLEASRPADAEPALLHGDFHADNCLIVSEPQVRVSAIIDWEMATVGDPLLDLGLFLAFWGSSRAVTPPAMPGVQRFSRAPCVVDRADLAARYSAATGRSVADLRWYMTLAFWKLAAIVEGAYAQLVSGTADSAYARNLAADVPALLAEAASFAGLA